MKNTKRSMLVSGLCLLLTAVMLMGSTFAWFTDSVTNEGNKIQSGTLHISLDIGSQTTMFNSDNGFKWEPGRSQKTVVTVSNEGSLWLKYTMSFANVDINGDADITEVLDVYKVAADAKDLTGVEPLGTMKELMAAGFFAAKDTPLAPEGHVGGDGYASSETFALVIKMQESADNRYQGCGVSFDVVVNATQYTYEQDGFGKNDYDAEAKYDFIPEDVTNTDNNLGISLAFEWALRTELKEAGVAVADNEPLTYKSLRGLTGTLDLSGYNIGSTITEGNKAMPTIDLKTLTEEEKALFDDFTTPWAISDLAYGLMGVTELNLSNTGIEYLPSMFLIGNPTIEKITLPDTLKSIGYTGTLEDGTLAWGYNAFSWMKNLKTINIPSSLQYLADYSFAESPNLELNIEDIPALVQSGRKIFRVVDCKNSGWLTESKVVGDVAVFAEKNKNADLQDFIFEGTAVTADAANISNNPLTYKSTFGNIKGITGTLTIPEGATLTAWMFDAWSIDTLNIPYSTTVTGQAFANNTQLTTVNVTYTGEEPTQEEKDAFVNSLFNGGTEATINWIAG